ncbi:MAG: aminotransferase [Spirosoma sp.]|nr:aminotransferase [Spirosoma sp.]
MFLLYNSNILQDTDYQIFANDRAFQYGDGLFETIRYEQSQVWFWPDHYARLTAGMKALHLTLPDNLSEASTYQHITDLLRTNELTGQPARIKIQVWRQTGGLYTPTTNYANILITAQPGGPFAITERAIVGILEAIRLHVSPYSAFKTLSSLPYVMAGIAKKERGLDDVILLNVNPEDYLAECLASNLFWFDKGVLYTPDIETGCVDGIMRQQILRKAKTVGQSVNIGFHRLASLSSAEAVFCCNVNGIQWIRSIEGIGLYPAGHDRASSLFTGLL